MTTAVQSVDFQRQTLDINNGLCFSETMKLENSMIVLVFYLKIGYKSTASLVCDSW